jgi:hypothetical protein
VLRAADLGGLLRECRRELPAGRTSWARDD